jgi:spore maturation protein CgeB
MKINKKIKILLCGQFFEHSLENSYLRAFKSLGVSVQKFELFNYGYFNTFFDKDRLNKYISSLSFRKVLATNYNRKLISSFQNIDTDICFFFDLTYIFPETIHFLKKKKIKTICFLPDNPLKGFLNYRPEILKSIRELDIFLCWGTKIIKELRKSGQKNAIFHTYAWDSIRNKKFRIKRKINDDIVFVGNWDDDREKIIDDLLKKFQVKIWGEQDWLFRSKSTKIKNSYTGKSAYNKKFSNICFNSFINLNILRKQSIEGGGLNMRSFEILGEKGLILQNYGPDAYKIFKNFANYVLFRNSDDMIKKIIFMKHHKNYFKKIKNELFNVINKDHTYVERSKKIISII